MNISIEEKLMYDVMQAIYNSGIPVNFKGSMVLKACLIEAGYLEETRHTVDIDANWYSNTPPSAEQMVKSLQMAIDKSGLELKVRLYRMYGEGRSAGFEISDVKTGEGLFTMDIDVNRPIPPTRVYEVAGVRFCGIAPIQMISDKVAAVSTDKVFQRIKDVVDLFYLSHIVLFNPADILETLKNSERNLGGFNGFLHHKDELQHSYEKFRFAGAAIKPAFDEVYQTVKAYIKDLLPRE